MQTSSLSIKNKIINTEQCKNNNSMMMSELTVSLHTKLQCMVYNEKEMV